MKTKTPGVVRVSVFDENRIVTSAIVPCNNTKFIPIPNQILWSPDSPFLYNLVLELLEDDNVLDRIESYFAMRKIELGSGITTSKAIYLNDIPIFLHGPLDQGYWPESGMTPPSEEAILFDLNKTKSLGFNMTRKHIKVEPRRWYYHADRIGLIVIQDMMSGGTNRVEPVGDVLHYLFGYHIKDTSKPYKKSAGRNSIESNEDFERELIELMDHLHNYPSILVWCPFNEAWGQYDAKRINTIVEDYDPTRIVDHASGWFDQGVGDFNSVHKYSKKLQKPKKRDQRVYLISEYGGYNLKSIGNMWDEKKKFSYISFKSKEELETAYRSLIEDQLIPLLKHGLGGAVYTQFSDVEIESNGFYTYDRKVLKIDEDVVAELNRLIYKEFRTLYNKKRGTIIY